VTSLSLNTRHYDVAVIGGGPNGIAFAIWIKQARPDTKIAVLEKKSQPGFKIGESTLAPTVEAILSLGFSLPMLRRLFHIKTGLRFWLTGVGPNPDEVGLHTNASDFDETFQLERNVFEELLHLQAGRMGVDVHRSTTVNIDESNIEGPEKYLICEDGQGQRNMIVRARLVADASGPAAVIPRHLGVYKRAGDDLNYNSYFAYFRRKKPPADDIPHWNVSATRHVHFPEGWVWFINITSWQDASRENLRRMMEHLLELPPQEGPDWPTRHELSEKFDCPVENIMSIGITPRADLDTAIDLPPEERFDHYVERYPGLKKAVSEFELIEDLYDDLPTHAAFMGLVHSSEQYAGDGWVAIGDAADFVNPLFSTGLAAGLSLGYFAAQSAVKALDSGDLSRAAFAEYEGLVEQLFPAIVRDTEMLYRAARHPDSYEQTYLVKFAGLVTFVLEMMMKHGGGDGMKGGPPGYRGKPLHPLAVNLTEPVYANNVTRIVEVLRAGEVSGEDPAVTAQKVREITEPYLVELRSSEAWTRLQMERVFADYNAQLERVDKPDWKPLLPTWRCSNCGTANVMELERCHHCGHVAERAAAAPV
jgi:flavin-dependent dehydrogenase